MGWSIKKPFGGKNSFVRRAARKPLATLVGGGLGAVYTDMKANAENKENEFNREQSAADSRARANMTKLERLAFDEEQKRKALGKQQQEQILGFAGETEARGADFRKTLAESLASTGRGVFERENPNILEDLNARGLFTSQTARDQEQGRLMKDIALQEQESLRGFDTDLFNELQDIRGTGLSALLGGDQSALDSALSLRKAGIQRQFDEADAAREQSFAEMMAKRQSRDQLIGSIIGLGGAGLIGLCFDPSTPIRLKSGEFVKMSDVKLGETLSDGGVVFSIRNAITPDGTFYDYFGVKVTGYHAVKEGQEWVRVKDSPFSKAIEGGGEIVSFGTTTHRLFIGGQEFADEFETDAYGEIGNSSEESLRRLNAQVLEVA